MYDKHALRINNTRDVLKKRGRRRVRQQRQHTRKRDARYLMNDRAALEMDGYVRYALIKFRNSLRRSQKIVIHSNL